jgi:hypothetical protein
VKKSRIETMPAETRRWIERALIEANFSGYEELEKLFRDNGVVISRSAIHRYGQKIERRFAAIKASTEAARLLTEGAADDQDARSEAVIALVQTEMFESIVNLQEAEESGMSDADRVALLSKAAKNIATLTRASVTLKKYQADVRTKVAAKMDELEAQARRESGAEGKAGFDVETLRRVRQEIYGLI